MKGLKLLALLGMSLPFLHEGIAQSQIRTEEEVLERIRHNNPFLLSLPQELGSKAHLVQQADLLPNPELSVTAEQFGESIQGSSPAQVEMRIDQRIERGGKREARVGIAQAEKDSAEIESSIQAQEILAQARRSWTTLLYLKGQIRLREEEIQLNREIVETVKRRVDAGATLPAELTKAETQGKSLEIERRTFQDHLLQEQSALASLWGGEASELQEIVETGVASRPLSSADFDPKAAPKYRLFESNCRRDEQVLRQEKSKAIQDVTLGAGYQRLQGVKYNAVLLSLSVPLPFSNRNEEGIVSAALVASSCRMKLQHLEFQLTSEVRNLFARLKTLQAERGDLHKSLLPSARKSLEQTRSAFALGRASFLEIADAQRNLISFKVRDLEIRKDTSETSISIDVLNGSSSVANSN